MTALQVGSSRQLSDKLNNDNFLEMKILKELQLFSVPSNGCQTSNDYGLLFFQATIDLKEYKIGE